MGYRLLWQRSPYREVDDGFAVCIPEVSYKHGIATTTMFHNHDVAQPVEQLRVRLFVAQPRYNAWFRTALEYPLASSCLWEWPYARFSDASAGVDFQLRGSSVTASASRTFSSSRHVEHKA